MPTRRAPTERQRRLGAELRKVRKAAGASTDHAAGLLGIDRTRVSNMEAGIRVLTPDRVRTLTSNYACGDAAYVEALVAMADTPERGWWEQYRKTLSPGLLDIAELEWHAARLRTIQTVHVPGLLQTEDYARAVFAAALPSLSRLDIELHVQHRLERQRLLDDRIARPYEGYVHEAALRMRFGGREVARNQLDHLCAMSEREHIILRVITVDSGAFPGSGHAMLYAEGAVPQLDTVQLDSAHGPVFTHVKAQLSEYRTHLEWMDRHALTAEESRAFISSLIHQL